MERINDPITLDVMTKYEAQGEETPEETYARVFNKIKSYMKDYVRQLNNLFNIHKMQLEKLKS